MHWKDRKATKLEYRLASMMLFGSFFALGGLIIGPAMWVSGWFTWKICFTVPIGFAIFGGLFGFFIDKADKT